MLGHLGRRLKCTFVISRCPSSVVNFSHFRLLLWNRWTEFNETLQEARYQRPLPGLCFFFGPVGKTRRLPWPLISWEIFDLFSETAERNSTKLDREQNINVLYQICVFGDDRKSKMAPLASDWLRHFRLLLWNRWTEFNQNWQKARSQSPLPSLCFSGRSEKKKQDGRPASDCLRHFRLLLWNCWTEFNETLQEARSQSPLPSLCFSGRSKKKQQDGRPGLWLAETFSTPPLQLRNGIQRNFTWSKISMSSTKFVFFGPIEKKKQDCLWLAEKFSTSSLKSLNGIQWNLTESKISTSSTKFVFFRLIRKARWPVEVCRLKPFLVIAL